MKVLVIDDEAAIRKLLTTALSGYGFEVWTSETGTQGLTEAATRRPDMILLDLGLPDRDGKEILKSLRTWFDGGVIVISVRDDETVIVDALDLGADDYVCKPFGIPELVARMKVTHRLRQVRQGSANETVWTLQNLQVDFTKRLVTLKGQEVRLTVTEYDLLAYFIKNRGKVLTHSQILHALWGPNSSEHRQYLRVYVRHLRQKIEEDPSHPKVIVTETGIGYRLMG